jgi:hypothetical protein
LNQKIPFVPLKVFKVTEIDHFPGLRLHMSGSRIVSIKLAWEISIKKWNLLHKLCCQGQLIEDGGVQTCGLCSLYFYGREEECEDCPILKAGHPGCVDTPYKEYVSAVKQRNLKRAKQAAAKEILFLKELSHGPRL